MHGAARGHRGAHRRAGRGHCRGQRFRGHPADALPGLSLAWRPRAHPAPGLRPARDLPAHDGRPRRAAGADARAGLRRRCLVPGAGARPQDRHAGQSLQSRGLHVQRRGFRAPAGRHAAADPAGGGRGLLRVRPARRRLPRRAGPAARPRHALDRAAHLLQGLGTGGPARGLRPGQRRGPGATAGPRAHALQRQPGGPGGGAGGLG